MTVTDIGYGAQFESWYDRIFPKDGSAARTAERLASWHPDPSAGTCELGVGSGRIAIPLTTRVGPVTGVDSSPQMLDALRADPESALVTPVHADIRRWRGEEGFGLVYIVCATLCMITDPGEQRAVVAGAAASLVPGGELVIEVPNKPAVLALHEGRSRATYFVPYPEPDTGLQTHSTLLDNDLWHCSHLWFENGRVRIGSELGRLTAQDELDAYATAAGLRPAGRYGDWELGDLTEGSAMVVARYRKPAGP
ncbi:class I SAM-dependent methyltransferase [Streptomyces sp. NPDC000594]|uniref:class I SAM-dependent methyltransferase n=1 Tax=Streptomyces sp. NPDC000594 TaxID=3154261 RepID=UPI00332C4607